MYIGGTCCRCYGDYCCVFALWLCALFPEISDVLVFLLKNKNKKEKRKHKQFKWFAKHVESRNARNFFFFSKSIDGYGTEQSKKWLTKVDIFLLAKVSKKLGAIE